ncbi:MAG: hypothetical protein FJ320_08595 [SAR202 cluster bacterium]|nr:hypothetical protein [SAR202 cluster bacterium]
MSAELWLTGIIMKVMIKELVAKIDGEERRINFARSGIARERLLRLKGIPVSIGLSGSVLLGLDLIDD